LTSIATIGTIIASGCRPGANGPATPAPSTADSSPDAEARRAPKAVVDRTPWEAGVISTADEFEHTFVLRNTGDAPLEVQPGPVSCKCSLVEVLQSPVPPGGETQVRFNLTEVSKNTHDVLKPGRQSRDAVLLTNDPQQPRLPLKIEATIVRKLLVDPPEVVFAVNVQDPSEKQRTGETLVFSQTWERFELGSVKSSLAGMKWRIEPLAQEKLKPLEAKSGYRVAVILPPDMPEDLFSESLSFSAKPAGSKDPPTDLRLPIHGRVEGRLTLTGPRFGSNQALYLGTLKRGENARGSFLMKVNDPRRSLAVTKVETTPEFVHVRVVPMGSDPAKAGVYRIEVDVSNALPGVFKGADAATVKLKTDHPRVPVIQFRVDFSVLSG
jgi:hypothetical protein